MEILKQPLFKKNANSFDLIINQCGFVKTDETWHQPPLYSVDSRLYFVTDGSGMLVSDTEKMPLEKGYVYLAPCGSKCGFWGTDSVTKLYFLVQLRFGPTESDLLSALKHFAKLPFPVHETKRLRQLYLSADPLDHILLKGAIYQTLCAFIQSEQINMKESENHSPCVKEAIGYISTHLNAKLTVREVAEAAFCSQSKLVMFFKKELGQSVAKYIDDLLMSEAKNQLIYTNSSIGKISDRLGFCDQFYFSRHFRNQFGISPSEYRKAAIKKD
jgi:AraC-like DNA-binding protein